MNLSGSILMTFTGAPDPTPLNGLTWDHSPITWGFATPDLKDRNAMTTIYGHL